MDEYARFADLYDTTVGPFLRPIHRAVLDAAPAPGGRLLDLCCGTGLLTEMALRTGVRAVGVDNSPSMIARARAVRPTVQLALADATDLPFSDKHFDAVALCFSLHEKTPDTGLAMLAEARRVLRPGGLLLTADYRSGRNGFGRMAGLGVALIERLAGKHHFECYREYMISGGTRAFLERAGFSPERTDTFLFGCAALYAART